LIVLSAPLIALLFQRGQFDARSTAETARALQFFALALFAHSGLEIVSRAFYALHDTFTPVAVGIGAMALNIALSVVLLPPLAHGGLALANSIATILEVSALCAILWRRVGAIDARRIARSIARIVCAAIVMAVVLVPFANYYASSPIFVALAGTLIGAVAYFIATFALRSEEIHFVLGFKGPRRSLGG
jgi:putative peptidoglycan lipid II flippase